MVEFVLLRSIRKKLLFIEAKTTFSCDKNSKYFNEQISEIIQKFLDSLYFIASITLNRKTNIQNLPENFPHYFDTDIQIRFLLVIKNHKKEWLLPLKLKIEQKIKKEMKIWGIEVIAINEETAKNWGIVKKE